MYVLTHGLENSVNTDQRADLPSSFNTGYIRAKHDKGDCSI